ncbi:hypothetical protein C0Z18_05280 [Trinickia dabaoshanensis]|uniref:Acetyltransferase n=1 Tax=Trinickia dabaoshanensis TaxID=564714 RepID=A0A2N7W035_9BURK|nr:DHH family phosphoesterase [Trinickia dabaoshanensis]PMS22764.1 hypothetical protein C0Z18_05280 [Trinickia dabaoshanensis]
MASTDSTERAPQAYDVFNGDADGLCALHQLRLATPRDAVIVTGVKRDVGLLSRVPLEAEIDVTVLDISLDANVQSLRALLDAGARIAYYDHHAASHAFAHPRLRFEWDDSPRVCTSLIVDRTLGGRYRPWAIVGAFGDNLDATARSLALTHGMKEHAIESLRTLGRTLNYNAYGETIDDLRIRPDELYRALHAFADPLDFIEAAPCFTDLTQGYRDDLAHADALAPYRSGDACALYVLPNEPWARRISGTFANRLCDGGGERSFAVLTERADGSYCVSVRSARPDGRPANLLCEGFESGGGRRAAAGVNVLPAERLDAFAEAFFNYFTTDAWGGPGPHGSAEVRS